MFDRMKVHFSAGCAVLERVRQLRDDRLKAPSDQRAALTEKILDLTSQAISEFRSAQGEGTCEKDPNLALIWAKLGESYELVSRNEEAMDAYKHAVDMHEQVPETKPSITASYCNNLGNVLGKLGKTDEAVVAYVKSAELDPQNAGTPWRNFGITLFNANRSEEAVEPLRKAIQLDPNNGQSWYLLGASLLAAADCKRLGDRIDVVIPPGLVEAYQKAIELDPNGRFGQEANRALEQLRLLATGFEARSEKRRTVLSWLKLAWKKWGWPRWKSAVVPTYDRLTLNSIVEFGRLIEPEGPPVYPEVARQAHVQGTVRFHLIIDTDGRIEELEVVSGHPLLIKSALDAVHNSRYKPTTVNGRPSKVDTTMDIVFRLK